MRFMAKINWQSLQIVLILLLLICIFIQKDTFAQQEITPLKQKEFDEFQIPDESEFSEQIEEEEDVPKSLRGLKIGIISLLFTILAGIIVRFRRLRFLRYLFLLGSLVFLGFWHGGCPCPISSFHNLFLINMGVDVQWHSLIWFLGLIPITYIFSRVWCGWICHLGALQEFIYIPNKFTFLKSERAQKIMRIMIYVFLIALIVQLFITKKNWFIHIDPFKVAFNFISFYTIGWILLGLLLVSSLFIYRPFCRAVCPVGLILGWINKIPGASMLGKSKKCTSCKRCVSVCPVQGINEKISFNNNECIMCGICQDICKKDAIIYKRRGGSNAKINNDNYNSSYKDRFIADSGGRMSKRIRSTS